jgi:hypothetical protein
LLAICLRARCGLCASLRACLGAREWFCPCAHVRERPRARVWVPGWGSFYSHALVCAYAHARMCPSAHDKQLRAPTGTCTRVCVHGVCMDSLACTRTHSEQRSAGWKCIATSVGALRAIVTETVPAFATERHPAALSGPSGCLDSTPSQKFLSSSLSQNRVPL